MRVELELWHLILLLMSFVGACWAFVRVFFAQFEKRLADRFAAQDAANKTTQDSLNKLLAWRAELPMQYVLRDDYIRNQTIIEAKLDRIAAKMEVLQLQNKASHDKH